MHWSICSNYESRRRKGAKRAYPSPRLVHQRGELLELQLEPFYLSSLLLVVLAVLAVLLVLVVHRVVQEQFGEFCEPFVHVREWVLVVFVVRVVVVGAMRIVGIVVVWFVVEVLLVKAVLLLQELALCI
jgi:hypothetical protein